MTAMTEGPIISRLAEEEENGEQVRIFRVPHYMRVKAPEDYEPQELFVGFYLHKSLVVDDPMHLDTSKLAIAREFCRVPKLSAPPQLNVPPAPTTTYRPVLHETWKAFVDSFDTDLLTNARQMYDRLDSDDATVTESENSVVILDALFIVAYLRFEYSFHDCWNYDFQSVFERSRFVAQKFPLLRDLLLLENQVPMNLLLHVLQYIRLPTMTDTPESMLYELLEWFVIHVYPFHHGVKLDVSSSALQQYLERSHKHGIDSFVHCDHLLDCAYLAVCGPYRPSPDETSKFCGNFLPCLKPASVVPSDNFPARNRFRIPSATSLKRVGITVKVTEDSLTMQNITFERHKLKYVLLVPKLIMNDYTASIFRNLAVYEQIRDNGFHTRGDMRTYLYLMSSLLDSVHDVRLLMNCGVIVNQLGSAEAVWQHWNQMCDGLFIPSIPPPYWSHIQDRITKLEKSKSNKWFTEIEERNFSSLIVFVSSAVFVTVLVATILQTVYSLLSYYYK